MAKFDTSRYAQLWEGRDARAIFNVFINDPNIIRANYQFWRSQFDVDPLTQQRQNDGTALFKVNAVERKPGRMADLRAPLGDANQEDKAGIASYTGSIPDFITPGYRETALEREARERMFQEAFGSDADLLAGYANDIQAQFDGANQTLSNMAAQLLSTGKIDYQFGKGIKDKLFECPIDSSHFLKAGASVWSDANAQLLDILTERENYARDTLGLGDIALKWQIPYKMYRNVFLNNAQVRDYIKNFRYVNRQGYVDNMPVTSAMFEEALGSGELFSPVEVVVEKQVDANSRIVSGWAENVAVLRPAGYAGKVVRANLVDQYLFSKSGASDVSKVFAQRDIFTFVNTTLNNGLYKEWHTDLMFAAIPVLDEWPYHIIVDTASIE